MASVIYDAGALRAVERRSPKMIEMHGLFLDGGRVPIVPTVVLGQVWRGTPRQATVARVLKACRPRVLDVLLAKQGGQLLAAAGTADLIDAVVAVLAMHHHAPIVTSDPDDLRVLVDAGWRKVPIFTV